MNDEPSKFEYAMNQAYKTEEFFDEHPNPMGLEIFKFEGLDEFTLYCDQAAKGIFLFEMKFSNWKKAQYYQRILTNLLGLSVDVYRCKKKLFLRKQYLNFVNSGGKR